MQGCNILWFELFDQLGTDRIACLVAAATKISDEISLLIAGSDMDSVIDEAQNLTRHELKTIITRVGDNTKIVLTGDIQQIDNVYVDLYSFPMTTLLPVLYM